VSKDAAEFTASIAHDTPLLESVVKINMAHTIMLYEREFVSREDATATLGALQNIGKNLKMKHELEDVHMNVEAAVVDQIGQRAGNLNLAKSRNDQVATAIRMNLRNEILEILSQLNKTRNAILKLAESNISTVAVGYTHLQHAQPVSLAHYAASYAAELARSSEVLKVTYSITNLSPMGAAALSTSTVPIDRDRVAELLGFDEVMENSLDAVSSRDFALQAIFNCVSIMLTLSRFAEELIIWSSSEFDTVEIDDRYSSTSSIMPQKKNAVVAELIRAKTGSVLGDLTAGLSIVKALPQGYNLDLQELTPHLWNACSTTRESLSIFAAMISTLKINRETMRTLSREGFTTAADLAEYLVQKANFRFREAHHLVGTLVREASAKKVDPLVYALEKVTKTFKFPRSDVQKVLDAVNSVQMHSVKGGPSRKIMRESLRRYRRSLRKDDQWILETSARLDRAAAQLRDAARQVIGHAE
jgi:argininosuccinate lyase